DRVDQVLLQQVHIASNDTRYSNTRFINDEAGRLTRYTHDNAYGVDYNYNTADQFDNYQVSTIKADSGGGTTTNTYDVNGHLISVDDGKETGVRKFFVDTAGHILRKEQKGDNTYSLLVNDQLIGTSSKDYLTDSINQSYVKQSALSGNGPSMYITQQGDTLQSIAKTVWGDATLWYLIADANGVVSADNFAPGTKILIPAREISSHNTADSFKPYRPGEIIGDTTPTLPMPQGQDGGCGMVGAIVSIAVAIILTVLTEGAASPLLNAAIAAASSTAGQFAAVAAGEQKEVNWKGVGLSALTAGLTQGINVGLSDQYANAIVNGALKNVASQGIAMVTGMQQDFSWKSVAGAAAGAAVGTFVGGQLKDAFSGMDSRWQDITQRSLKGFASGVATSLVNGGKIQIGRVAVDAFGNALGESLAAGNVSNQSDAETARLARYGKDAANAGISTYNGPSVADVLGTLDPIVQAGPRKIFSGYDPAELQRAGYPRNAMFIDQPVDRSGTLIQGTDTTTLYQSGMQTVQISHKKMTLEEMAQYDEELEAAHQAKIAQDNSRAYSMSKWEGFLTFNPVGQTINGASKAAYNFVKIPANLVQGTGTLIQDAYGYSKQAIFGPDRGVMGDIRPYHVQNGIVRSFARRGAMETMGDFVYGVAKSAPGVGLIDSMYRRDYDGVGGQIFNLGTMYAGAKIVEANSRFYKVESGGVRGEAPLNVEQRLQVESYLSKFDTKGIGIRWVDDTNLSTGYGDMFGQRTLNIGSDVVPGNVGVGTSTANSRISIKGTLAHELVGHMEAGMAGRTQASLALEEAQASIRAARFAPELSSTERYSLLRDGIMRLQRAPEGPIRVRDVKDSLYIQHR
ncbi:LysM peptidoglycan-binding domain-containing protein, partial [Undibacterium sp. Di27W]|uniref:LysM peptidoglycan-binding domain-containing protein n=1 Tax=Undibacterium sp. Di27W TaxID=3413036 RepID=UPI003BF24B2E